MKPPAPRRSRLSKAFLRIVIALIVLYLVLLLPERTRPAPAGAGQRPFSWNRDAFWSTLERQYQAARIEGCDALAARIDAVVATARHQLDTVRASRLPCGDRQFDALETNLFVLAPMVASCPKQLPDYLQLYTRM